MSADLFAEFVYDNGGQKSQAAPPQASAVTSPQGEFDFSSFGQFSTAVPAPVQQETRWPAPDRTQPSGNIWDGFSSLSGQSQAQSQPVQTDRGAVDDEDDTWGDFEVAEPSTAAPPGALLGFQMANRTTLSGSTPVAAPDPRTNPDSDLTSRNRVIRASTVDLLTNNLIDVGSAPRQPPKSAWAKAERQPAKPRDPNVLFDADDDVEEDDGDDDFGDFETVQAPIQPVATSSSQRKPQHVPPSMDLLSLTDPAPSPASATAPTPATTTANVSSRKAPGLSMENLNVGTSSASYSEPPKSPSFQERNPFPGLAVATPKTESLKRGEKPSSPSPITAWPSFDDKTPGGGDDWAAFEDFPARDTKQERASNKEDSWDWETADISQATKPIDESEPPPTNVPPPSVLMSVLPEILNLSDTALLKPIAGQTAAAKKMIMSDPKTVAFLRSYLLIATVAARILAGRKLRWHRDKFLSQRMTISTAGAKGMKLAGVDKAQGSREDREAADVAASWKAHVGKLRSAVAAANAAGSGAPLKVPEIGEQMHVTTAKQVPTAPRPCVICGLKRDERLTKVDFEVEDSFGEWWVEHWGHRACRNFWMEHEKKLRQR